jgi:hypothetical protein
LVIYYIGTGKQVLAENADYLLALQQKEGSVKETDILHE